MQFFLLDFLTANHAQFNRKTNRNKENYHGIAHRPRLFAQIVVNVNDVCMYECFCGF